MFLSCNVEQHLFKIKEEKITVADKSTNKVIPRVIWANDETGRYRQYLVDENGKLIVDYKKGRIKSKVFKGNIKFNIGIFDRQTNGRSG